MVKGWKRFVLCCIFCAGSYLLYKQSSFALTPHVKKTNKPIELQPVDNARTQIISNCIKPSKARTYVICKKLPYINATNKKLIRDQNACRGCVVPNVVHYVWFGNRTLLYYHYLSVRSVAVHQKPDRIVFYINKNRPQGSLWNKLLAEISNLVVVHMEAPTHVFGHAIENVLHQTDVARNEILLKYGGIYFDSDVIVLKSLDPLRQYSFTMGRSTKLSLSNGAMLSEPNAPFLQAVMEEYKLFRKDQARGTNTARFSCRLPMQMWKTRKDLTIHVENTSMQRPNPWHDGRACISHDSYDISENYMLHIHPQKSSVLEYGVDELRVSDTTYGAAARGALFGTQDLVFVEGEVPKERKKPKPILPIDD